MRIPDKIQVLIGGRQYAADKIGMSGSNVLLFDDMVLKIQPDDEESKNEYRVMQWLSGRLPAPEAICYETDGKTAYLLMSRVSGKMTCDESCMRDPKQLVHILAEGLRMLWNTDCSDCPCVNGLDRKLRMARENVTHGLVDMDNAEPETFGENGFRTPAYLLEWLLENRPAEELVLSHGDYCLPNIFAEDGRLSGFIDLGRMGVADRWQDIALLYRSLSHNYGGKYGGAGYDGDFRAEMLFEALGIEPDWEKIKYYILLDELF